MSYDIPTDITDRERELLAACGSPSDVPCNGCTACCRSVVAIRPDLGDNPADYQCAMNVDVSAPNRLATFSLDRKPDGSCYALRNGKCTIWEKRPVTCRVFDCRRIFALYSKAERRELIRDRYFSRDIIDAGKKRYHTLPDAEELKAVAQRVGFGRISIAYMDGKRGVKKGTP